MRIAIVDDEGLFRGIIEEQIDSYYGKLDNNCSHFSDGSELINAISLGDKFDAIFMDIEMKDLDGMSAARLLRTKGVLIPIIFVTSHIEMAMEGYEVSAFRFLEKPVNPEKLKKVLQDLDSSVNKDSKYAIKKDGETIIVSLSDILYLESMGNDVVFHFANMDDIKIRMKFSDCLKELSNKSSDFFKIHRCTIINLNSVCQYSSNEVSLKDGTRLIIARGCQASFRDAMFDFVRRNGR